MTNTYTPAEIEKMFDISQQLRSKYTTLLSDNISQKIAFHRTYTQPDVEVFNLFFRLRSRGLTANQAKLVINGKAELSQFDKKPKKTQSTNNHNPPVRIPSKSLVRLFDKITAMVENQNEQINELNRQIVSLNARIAHVEKTSGIASLPAAPESE